MFSLNPRMGLERRVDTSATYWDLGNADEREVCAKAESAADGISERVETDLRDPLHWKESNGPGAAAAASTNSCHPQVIPKRLRDYTPLPLGLGSSEPTLLNDVVNAIGKNEFLSTDDHVRHPNTRSCYSTPTDVRQSMYANISSPESRLRTLAMTFKNTPSIIRKRTSRKFGNASTSDINCTPEVQSHLFLVVKMPMVHTC